MKSPLLSRLHQAATKLFNGRQLERILVTVRHPDTGEIAQIGHDRQTNGIALSQGYAMIAEPVRIGGRQIGQIELHAAASSLRAAHLFQLAQSLHEEIERAIAA